MDQETRNRLLQSIEVNRLVVLCGAGLSMAEPSSLPSARQIAEACHDKYCLSVDPDFDPSIRHDLEAIAEYFAERNGTLISYFIRDLVPWTDFMRPSNPGHKALADFLICRAVFAVLSSNYDDLIELPARQNYFTLQVSLDGDEAGVHENQHSPLLKFHGCANKDRDHTVWTRSQLDDDPVISKRIQNSRGWMEVNLREKDLLVVGFWSDWAYLNEIIGSALENVTPLSITVFDTADTEALQEKAPQLWAKAHSEGVSFHHVQESGAGLLDELRTEFSRAFMRKVFAQGSQALEAEFGIVRDSDWLEQPEMTSEEHYRWRRDAEGVGIGAAPRRKQPEENEILGFFHLLLRRAGSVVNESGYSLGGRTMRVVNGSGQRLSTMRKRMCEPPTVTDADFIVCVNSIDDSDLPDNFVRSGRPKDTIRPQSTAKFVTHEQARDILAI